MLPTGDPRAEGQRQRARNYCCKRVAIFVVATLLGSDFFVGIGVYVPSFFALLLSNI